MTTVESKWILKITILLFLKFTVLAISIDSDLKGQKINPSNNENEIVVPTFDVIPKIQNTNVAPTQPKPKLLKNAFAIFSEDHDLEDEVPSLPKPVSPRFKDKLQNLISDNITPKEEQSMIEMLANRRRKRKKFLGGVKKFFKKVGNAVKKVVKKVVHHVKKVVKKVVHHVKKAVKAVIKHVVKPLIYKIFKRAPPPPPDPFKMTLNFVKQSTTPPPPPPNGNALFGSQTSDAPPPPPLLARPPGIQGRVLDPNFPYRDMPEKCQEGCNGHGKCLMDEGKLVVVGAVQMHPYSCRCNPLYTGVACQTRIDQYLRWFESNGTTEFPPCCNVCPSQFRNPTNFEKLPVYQNPFSVGNCDPSVSVDSRPDNFPPCFRPLHGELAVDDTSIEYSAQSSSNSNSNSQMNTGTSGTTSDASSTPPPPPPPPTFLEEKIISHYLYDIDDEFLKNHLLENVESIDLDNLSEDDSSSFIQLLQQRRRRRHHKKFFGAVKKFFKKAANVVKKVVHHVKKVVKKVVHHVKKIVKKVVHHAKKIVKKVVHHVKKAVKAVVHVAKKVIQPISQAAINLGAQMLANAAKNAELRSKEVARAWEEDQKRKNADEARAKKVEQEATQDYINRISTPLPQCCIYCDFDFWTQMNTRPDKKPQHLRSMSMLKNLERQRIVERIGNDAVLREIRRRETQRRNLLKAKKDVEQLEQQEESSEETSFIETGSNPRSTRGPVREYRKDPLLEQMGLKGDRDREECCTLCPIASENPKGVAIDEVTGRPLTRTENRYGTFLYAGREVVSNNCCEHCPSQFWMRTVSQDIDPFSGESKLPGDIAAQKRFP